MEAIQGGCASVPTARIMASACLSVPPTSSCARKALHIRSAQRCTPDDLPLQPGRLLRMSRLREADNT